MSSPATALVTGASRGIGRSLARELVRAGVEVYGTGRDEEALAETQRTCEPSDRFHPLVVHVSSERDVARAVAEPPRLDLCINNAGIARLAPILDTSRAELEEVLGVNVIGAFLVMRDVAARMVREGGGRIVTIASDVAYRAAPGIAAYGASKHAVSGLSKTLAEELGPAGVQVTTVYPGGVGTEILGDVTSGNPRLMNVDEVARTIVATLMAAGTTVRVAELHLQPWRPET